MCVFITKSKYFTFNFGDQIVKSLNGAGIPYFKLVTKNNKTVKRLKTLKTIKFIQSVLSCNQEGKRRYVLNGKSVIYLDSIPKPILIKSIKVYNLKNESDMSNPEDIETNSELIKSLFCLRFTGKRKAKIMNKIKEIFPIELRTMLFQFSMKYIDTFSESDLCHFEELVNLCFQNSKDSTLLDYISCNNNPPLELINGNPIFLKLLKFVSSTHPWIK